MVKLGGSFRLDDEHRQVVHLRALELGMSMSEYVRFLIEKDASGKFRKPSDDLKSKWIENRSSVILSDTQTTLLSILKKELESKGEVKGKSVKSLDDLCKKYFFDMRVVKNDLKRLVNSGIFTIGDGETSYTWTKQGIIMLSEFACDSIKNNKIVDGDITSLLSEMFGKYDEVIEHIQISLQVSKEVAIDVFDIILLERIMFLNWMRDFVFSMTDIANPNLILFYRKMMIHFLFTYCMIIRDPALTETSNEFRIFCDQVVNLLAKTMSGYTDENLSNP